jgi:hypothetical protein
MAISRESAVSLTAPLMRCCARSAAGDGHAGPGEAWPRHAEQYLLPTEHATARIHNRGLHTLPGAPAEWAWKMSSPSPIPSIPLSFDSHCEIQQRTAITSCSASALKCQRC